MAGELPRLVAIMGSGETSPTMVKVHRALFDRLGPPPVPAVVLDTPVGFQENAEELAGRAVAYFAESVGRPVDVASWRSPDDGPLALETMLARVGAARWVFAGPGSPSYALRHWSATRLPDLLRDKLRNGGCVTFASAAALTLGRFTVPVYEIYKVGEEPRWLDGLDLLAEAGLDVAVIPHYDNAEGGTHDTRYCYLGERRLAVMEEQLPPEAFVLGVDEHTACVLDLDAGTATVAGLGGVTVRRRGRSHVHASGSTVALTELGVADGRSTGPAAIVAPVGGPAPTSPILEEADRCRAAFDGAVADDPDAAVAAALELEQLLADWSRETFSSDELPRARGVLRGMLVRLGEEVTAGIRDRRPVVAPYVEALLEARERARADGRFADADAIRDGLAAAGVEVRDGREGTTWQLLS